MLLKDTSHKYAAARVNCQVTAALLMRAFASTDAGRTDPQALPAAKVAPWQNPWLKTQMSSPSSDGSTSISQSLLYLLFSLKRIRWGAEAHVKIVYLLKAKVEASPPMHHFNCKLRLSKNEVCSLMLPSAQATVQALNFVNKQPLGSTSGIDFAKPTECQLVHVGPERLACTHELSAMLANQ